MGEQLHADASNVDKSDELFIISESPVIATSTAERLPLMILLRISGKAGLFGTDRDVGQPRTMKMDVGNLRQIRAAYTLGAKPYLVSPKRPNRF